LLDLWNGESVWLIVNNKEVWRHTSSWRIHGSPTCLSPYSDLFIAITKEIQVRSGTTSLDIILEADLRTAITVASFGFTSLTVEILPVDDTTLNKAICAYTVPPQNSEFWFEVSSPTWQPGQIVSLECANGNRIPCSDWFNRYTCQSPDGKCASPRSLYIEPPPSVSPANDSFSEPICCSLGRSCTALRN